MPQGGGMEIFMEISKAVLSLCENVSFNEPMKKHTTFKTGGNADIFCEPKNTDELKELIRFFRNNSVRFAVIGNGSNLLVSDKGFRGAVIRIGRHMSRIEVKGETIKSEAGALLSGVAKTALKEGLSGMERISGIPGSVGGAIYMNAGSYGSEIGNITESAAYLLPNGEIVCAKRSDLRLEYRNTSFMENNGIIVSCTLKLKYGNKDKIAAEMAEVAKKRICKQPLELPSAGSFFKRPEGHFAGKLIEDCGMKGYTVGGAKISEKHAGFIVNFNNASSADIIGVMNAVRERVFKETGIMLEPEIRFLGEF